MQLTLRVLYALVPSLCNIAAFVIALAYPISRSVHKDILAAIDQRRAGQSVADPLNPERTLGQDPAKVCQHMEPAGTCK